MTLHVLNDLHLGAVRSGGTTQATAWQLRLDLLEGYNRLLNQIDSDLLINGDLFDGADISKYDLLATLRITSDWLVRAGKRLFLSTGNHDIARNTTNYSSFQFFAQLLVAQFPDQVVHISGGQLIAPNMYVLSHVANQDIFNLELERVPECDYLFLHANYNNGFAVESDHSLNVSEDQARKLSVKHIVFGHEHQGRVELGDKVVITGNQLVSSISDCLGNAEKCMLRIEDDGNCTLVPVWKAEGDFSEQDWRSLEDRGRFIRVVGEATAEEANQVVDTISRFRAKASALVITNAVKIAGVNDVEQFQISHEQVTSFSVRDALREFLTDEENQKIDNLQKEEENAA